MILPSFLAVSEQGHHDLYLICVTQPVLADALRFNYSPWVVLLLFRSELEEAVQEAKRYVERFHGHGSFATWLATSTDKAQLQELDRRLRDAMQGFQVRGADGCCSFMPLACTDVRCDVLSSNIPCTMRPKNIDYI